jgi:hypothetical protein
MRMLDPNVLPVEAEYTRVRVGGIPWRTRGTKDDRVDYILHCIKLRRTTGDSSVRKSSRAERTWAGGTGALSRRRRALAQRRSCARAFQMFLEALKHRPFEFDEVCDLQAPLNVGDRLIAPRRVLKESPKVATQLPLGMRASEPAASGFH